MRGNAALPPGRLELYRFLGLLARTEDYPPKDGPYQDYTYFQPCGLEAIRRFWARTLALIRAGKAPRDIGIYLHWPFCPSQCTYCFCSMTVPESAEQMRAYAAMLKREMDALKDVFEGFAFSSLYLGGGTPTFLSPAEMDGLLDHLRRSFRFEPGAEVYVEASPATLTPAMMDTLTRHGVNRVTLGVQTLDAAVLQRVRRAGQTPRNAREAFELLSRTPGVVADVDLVFGLEGQSRLSFIRDLAWALKRRPEVLHFYGFDPRPQTLFSRAGGEPGPQSPSERRLTLELADRMARAAGYRSSAWDPVSASPHPLEERQDGGLRREGASVLGLGYTAKSHAFGSAWYEHRPVGRTPLRTDGLPPYYFLPSPPVEEMRGWVVRGLAGLGRVSREAFRARFGRDLLSLPALSARVRELEALGKLRVSSEELSLERLDPAARLVWLKHLYSAGLLRRLLAAHRSDYLRFVEERSGDPAGVLRELERRVEARSQFRVYYRGAPAAGAAR